MRSTNPKILAIALDCNLAASQLIKSPDAFGQRRWSVHPRSILFRAIVAMIRKSEPGTELVLMNFSDRQGPTMDRKQMAEAAAFGPEAEASTLSVAEVLSIAHAFLQVHSRRQIILHREMFFDVALDQYLRTVQPASDKKPPIYIFDHMFHYRQQPVSSVCRFCSSSPFEGGHSLEDIISITDSEIRMDATKFLLAWMQMKILARYYPDYEIDYCIFEGNPEIVNKILDYFPTYEEYFPQNIQLKGLSYFAEHENTVSFEQDEVIQIGCCIGKQRFTYPLYVDKATYDAFYVDCYVWRYNDEQRIKAFFSMLPQQIYPADIRCLVRHSSA